MKRFLVLFSLILVCSGIGLLQAGSFGSQAGLASCVYNFDGSVCSPYGTTTVAITPHSAWAPDFAPEAVWISYRDTGITGASYEPYKGTVPVFAVTETFSVSAGTLLKFSVWGDDTVGVYLDGNELKAPNFTQATCANGQIGCEVGEGGHYSLNLGGGVHNLRFDVYQVGTGTTSASNPMGLLYQGTVPDGGMTLMLLGGALVGLETWRRRCRM